MFELIIHFILTINNLKNKIETLEIYSYLSLIKHISGLFILSVMEVSLFQLFLLKELNIPLNIIRTLHIINYIYIMNIVNVRILLLISHMIYITYEYEIIRSISLFFTFKLIMYSFAIKIVEKNEFVNNFVHTRKRSNSFPKINFFDDKNDFYNMNDEIYKMNQALTKELNKMNV